MPAIFGSLLLTFIGQQVADPAAEWERLVGVHERAAEAQNAGDYATAERLHREVLDGSSRLPGFPPSQRARLMSNLASVLTLQDRPAEALLLLRKAEALLGDLSKADPLQVITLHGNLADAYAAARDYKLAEERYDAGFKLLEAHNALQTLPAHELSGGIGWRVPPHQSVRAG